MLFDNSGTWYKGNLHTHTLRSDGLLSPEAVVEVYRNAGYDFIALTDHWVQSENQEVENGFLILGGCEWNTGNDMAPVFHIVGIGMEKQVDLKNTAALGPQEIIDAITAAGGLAILAHPAWSLDDPEECLQLKGLSGAEIYNSVSFVPWNGRRADSSLYFDLWANKGKRMPCFAADDSHFYEGEQTRSFLMVNAPELTADAIKTAIATGNFYASQGPLFDSVRIEGNRVEVKCSEVQTVVFYSNTVWCEDRVTSGTVTSASYRIKPTDKYVRVELIDKDGRMAWSSPFWVNR
jgi:hypothetical protein